MGFWVGTVAALVLLFAAASCAPAGPGLQGACEDVQSSSLELNHVARAVSVKARNASKDVMAFSTSLDWMEAKDMCDPGTLKQESATCMEKILDVLAGYKSAVEKMSGFKDCSTFVNEVIPAIQKLHKHVSKCGTLKGENLHQKHKSIEEVQPIPQWQKTLLCQYTMDRLFSFSILAARVFALGDPARHTAGSPQRCP